MVARFVPALKPGAGSVSITGAVTMFVCLISLLLALTLGQQAGFTSHSAWHYSPPGFSS
jgi:hypothetical protein